jgi:hypothetical protein
MKPELSLSILTGRGALKPKKNAAREQGRNPKQKHVTQIGAAVSAMLLSIVAVSPVYGATEEAQVGVTAASNLDAVGKTTDLTGARS